jgi:hypothetical protein
MKTSAYIIYIVLPRLSAMMSLAVFTRTKNRPITKSKNFVFFQLLEQRVVPQAPDGVSCLGLR